MLYVLFPHGGERDDIRVFATYAIIEQEVIRMATLRKSWGVNPDWCLVIAYDGVDELVPIWGYYVTSSMLLGRYAINPSPLGS